MKNFFFNSFLFDLIDSINERIDFAQRSLYKLRLYADTLIREHLPRAELAEPVELHAALVDSLLPK